MAKLIFSFAALNKNMNFSVKNYHSFFIFLLIFAFPVFSQTRAELNSSDCEDYRQAEAEMNKTYQELLKHRRRETRFLAALRTEQSLWTAYRDAQMKTTFALKPGETVKSRYDEFSLTCRCEHLEKITVERMKVLQELLSDANTLDDGNVCGTSSIREAQTQIIEFDKAGEVRVAALETLTKPLQLMFLDAETGRELAAFKFQQKDSEESYRPRNFHSPVSALLRFKTIFLENLNQPLIFAVAINPGGSDHGFMVQVFGEDEKGKFKAYTSEPLNTAIVGGVHFGDLGAGRGLGLAVWNYIWDENEGHSGAHIFEVEMFPYDKNKKMFVRGEKLRTKKKYDSERAALDELKLSFFVDQLSSVPGIESYREKGSN